MQTTKAVSPLDPSQLEDPYPSYEVLRAGPALSYFEEDDIWVASRFDVVREILRRPTEFSNVAVRGMPGGAIKAVDGYRPDLRALHSKMAATLVATDQPDHTRMRRLVTKPFTPRGVAEWEPMVTRVAASLVEDLAEKASSGPVDLVDAFAVPFPIVVIAEILGIPSDRRADFKRWSDALQDHGEGEHADTLQSITELSAYFAQIIEERRADPQDDLISWIVQGSDLKEEPLSDRDLVSFCALLLLAGNETTTNLLGNTFNAFFQNPDQFELAWKMSDLRPAVEEILRYDTSIQWLPRLVNEEAAQVGDTTLPRDAMLLLVFGAANRDESRWSDAAELRLDRPAQDHLGFGAGIHLCLGADLARLEMRVVLELLRERFRSIEPAGPPTRRDAHFGLGVRGFSAMPVTFELK